MFSLCFSLPAACLLALHSVAVHAQILPLDQFWNATAFPNEQKQNVTKYLNQALDLATDRSIYQYFQDQCIVQQVYPPLFSMPPGFVKPFAAFDNFYFVGHGFVSAWAYNTGDGLILIDALDNQEEIEAVLLPGLAEFGFKGSDIKHVIITHEHIDHFGGARYLQEKFGAVIYAAEDAWKELAIQEKNNSVPVPTRDKVVTDGDVVKAGNVSIEIVYTPGHTLGTISLIFPVFDHAKPHLAGLSGGTGTPQPQNLRELKITSQSRFADIAREKGVDALVSNHNVADHALFHADILAHRGPNTANPFVVGVENFEKYIRINALCSRVIAARQGMDLLV
ncbi:hypothetical protein LCI18_007898 [Fusarium solani-melongenae]|uniref:Uncharacterized protein n=1 Tax=Fusarium solani subsp. cucurbitae TaxID=2747967 RepID=A0ACD3ZA64_FUSSC|nr:hypothetical protein LCI18_007898 [Fusarium solani-melongenae]